MWHRGRVWWKLLVFLLKHGTDIEARDTDDWSPLERATTNGHVEVTRVILEHGANVNAQDIKRCTSLYWILDWGRSAVAQVFLRHGADVKARNEDNETPLQYSIQVMKWSLGFSGTVQMLTALDFKNRTLLHLASELGRVGTARVLLERGVDANASDANNATPLHLASGSNYLYEGLLDIVRLLLQCGSDIHARDKESQTPIMRATAEDYHDILRLLLEHGGEQGVITRGGQRQVM
jgi:ankyrin repeat protein